MFILTNRYSKTVLVITVLEHLLILLITNLIGMLIGAYTWGSLADQIGRKTCLFFSITMNGVFGLASAFVEHSVSFGILRFLSGVGVGASFPVVFSYYAEFLTKKLRGRLISWLSLFWMFGQITTSIFAVAVIPRVSEIL